MTLSAIRTDKNDIIIPIKKPTILLINKFSNL